jgi:hypothetical protein
MVVVVDLLGRADPPRGVRKGDRWGHPALGSSGEMVKLAEEAVGGWQVDLAPLPSTLDPDASGSISGEGLLKLKRAGGANDQEPFGPGGPRSSTRRSPASPRRTAVPPRSGRGRVGSW